MESWTGSVILGQETSRMDEGREVGYIAVCLLAAVPCISLFTASSSCVFSVQRYCSDNWDALDLCKSCRNYVFLIWWLELWVYKLSM